MKKTSTSIKKKALAKIVPTIYVSIKTSMNNTILTATDSNGNTLGWSSGGTAGFKGSKRSSNYAAQVAGESLGKMLLSHNPSEIFIKLKGMGFNAESAIKGLKRGNNLPIKQIFDLTSIPFNGCRLKKRRRL